MTVTAIEFMTINEFIYKKYFQKCYLLMLYSTNVSIFVILFIIHLNNHTYHFMWPKFCYSILN